MIDVVGIVRRSSCKHRIRASILVGVYKLMLAASIVYARAEIVEDCPITCSYL